MLTLLVAGLVVLLLGQVIALQRERDSWRNRVLRELRAAAASAPSLPVERPARAPDQLELRGLEEQMEALAVEVERIGEGQRFLTRLLNERPRDTASVR